MTTFAIDHDNNITVYSQTPSGLTDVEFFTSEKELTKLTASWPMTRLLDVWNSFAGSVPFDDLKPVKKFTDRKSAVGRIWKAVQRLTPAAAPPVAHVQPTAAEANGSGGAGKASKTAQVLELLRRPTGATLSEIMTATDWQSHTVRGYISGTVTKKLGLQVESFRGKDNQRTYRINR